MMNTISPTRTKSSGLTAPPSQILRHGALRLALHDGGETETIRFASSSRQYWAHSFCLRLAVSHAFNWWFGSPGPHKALRCATVSSAEAADANFSEFNAPFAKAMECLLTQSSICQDNTTQRPSSQVKEKLPLPPRPDFSSIPFLTTDTSGRLRPVAPRASYFAVWYIACTPGEGSKTRCSSTFAIGNTTVGENRSLRESTRDFRSASRTFIEWSVSICREEENPFRALHSKPGCAASNQAKAVYSEMAPAIVRKIQIQSGCYPSLAPSAEPVRSCSAREFSMVASQTPTAPVDALRRPRVLKVPRAHPGAQALRLAAPNLPSFYHSRVAIRLYSWAAAAAAGRAVLAEPPRRLQWAVLTSCAAAVRCRTCPAASSNTATAPDKATKRTMARPTASAAIAGARACNWLCLYFVFLRYYIWFIPVVYGTGSIRRQARGCKTEYRTD